MYTIFGFFGLLVLWGMIRSWKFLHDKLQAFYTGHPKTDKILEGKLHAGAALVATILIALSLTAMFGFYGAGLLRVLAGFVLTAYIVIAVMDAYHLVLRTAKRIAGTDAAKSLDSKPADTSKPADKK